jgi:membrane-bound serine protease (ClpP class)
VRRLAIALLAGALVAGVASTLWSGSGAADEQNTGSAADLAPVDVLQVSGLIDPIVADSILDGIARAEDNGSQALILQLNSLGGVVDAEDMQAILQRIVDTPIAIGVWVGPARSSRAYGYAAQLLAVADVSAMVAGSRIGNAGPLLEVNGEPVSFGPATPDLIDGTMSFTEARAAGVLRLDTTDQGVPTVRNMVLAMDGVTAKGVELDTVVDEVQPDGSVQATSTLVRFSGLGFTDEVMHQVASPSIAYLMFVAGLALLIFELFTAGVGVAGVVGALCTIAGCYGLATLPTNLWAAALIVLAMVAFAIDVQVGLPRFWTAVGMVLFSIGSWFLYGGLPGVDLRVGWLMLVVGIVGVALTFVVGMPSMVRTRFATPTIGREWMIGQMGSATTSISPDGVALVSGARWRARTNRATPIAAGGVLRVVAIDGVTLEVEPEVGAARDYRERRADPET